MFRGGRGRHGAFEKSSPALFGDPQNQKTILELAPQGVDLILSDMAPDTTGVHYADTEDSALLVHLALDMAEKLLKPGGSFVAKVFEGAEYKELLIRTKKMFELAKSYNPKASLNRSRELFLVAQQFKKTSKPKTAKPKMGSRKKPA